MDLSSVDVGYEGSDSTEEYRAQGDQNYRVQLSSASYTEVHFHTGGIIQIEILALLVLNYICLLISMFEMQN